MPLTGELGAGFCLEALGELEEFGREMVDSVGPVVKRPMLGARVARMIEAGAHAPAM